MKITQKTLFKSLPTEEFKNTTALLLLSQQMHDFMSRQGGIGLAANQIGQEKRMFVMNVKGPKTCVNPEVIRSSEEIEYGYEGCLSFKGEFLPIDRAVEIDVQYQTWNGIVVKETIRDLEARCFLHELDHLNGITMYKRKKLNELTGTTEKELNN